MKLYERIENNNFDEIDRNRAIELIEGGNGHLVYNENYFKLQKENEELKQERELVGVPVRNKRDGKIGIILHQWKSGSIAVLENIKPRVINTHDDWNTLEIINDNVEQKRTKNDCIPIQKVKDKIETLKKTNVNGEIFTTAVNFAILTLQELIEEREEK